MCGIFGHIGFKKGISAQVCLQGLKRLEYRGYDSAGISGIKNREIETLKHVGKVSTLNDIDLSVNTAIAHTRWATHGAITKKNAHPHLDETNRIALVHNGIIENYVKIKKELQKEGIHFQSETDTEVIAHLLLKNYSGSLFETMCKVTPLLEGSYAFSTICKDEPNTIVCAAKSAPLIIGKCCDTGEIYISSDTAGFTGMTLDIFYLENEEIAMLTTSKIVVVNKHGVQLVKKEERLEMANYDQTKDGHEHYLLKEILEQPQALTQAISDRIDYEKMTARFSELSLSDNAISDHAITDYAIKHCDQIVILACGSSYHSGCIAKQMIETIANKRVSIEIASEFRYSHPLLTEKSIVIAISQSGETADTIAAIELAKTMTEKVIALCNVMTSTIARMVPNTIDLKAGPEISVCSTKAFTSQLIILFLLALKFGRINGVGIEKGKELIDQLKMMLASISQVISERDKIEKIAERAQKYEHVFFIGRQEMYPTCLEAALKLKEISYIHALGIAAGELKHGTIALITEKTLTVALCGNEKTLEKLESNIMEITSRKGPVIAFANAECDAIGNIVDDVIFLPKIADLFAPFTYAVATQLFAYYIAKMRKCDIDQPRNLAKSVTVE